ncbi:hypothetical protein [Mucilaginibacter sp.]
MTTQNTLPSPFIQPALLRKNILAGAGIGLVVISFFVLPFPQHPNPAWGKLWMVRPLIVTPLAGAVAGACFYAAIRLGSRGGWQKILFTALGIFGYIIAIWMGIILGLADTMWH